MVINRVNCESNYGSNGEQGEHLPVVQVYKHTKHQCKFKLPGKVNLLHHHLMEKYPTFNDVVLSFMVISDYPEGRKTNFTCRVCC